MPTSLAVFWGDTLWDQIEPAATADGMSVYDYAAGKAGARARLDALAEAADRLQQDFGSWGTAWGQINRFQRLDDAIEPHFDDAAPSIPVPFVSSRWGSLASFGAHRWPGTKRYYGTSGNSFVAVVEFAPRVRARADHGRRRERASGLAALRRRGGALHHRQSAPGVLLAGGNRRAHRAHLPSRRDRGPLFAADSLSYLFALFAPALSSSEYRSLSVDRIKVVLASTTFRYVSSVLTNV